MFLPGDERRSGESCEAAAVRVVREVTALEAAVVGELGEFDEYTTDGRATRPMAVAVTVEDTDRTAVSGCDGYVWYPLLDDPDGAPGVVEIMARYREDPRSQAQREQALEQFAAELRGVQAALDGPAEPEWKAAARAGFDRQVPVPATWLDDAGITENHLGTPGGDGVAGQRRGRGPGPSRERMATLLTNAMRVAYRLLAKAGSPEDEAEALARLQTCQSWASAVGVRLSSGGLEAPENDAGAAEWHRGGEVPVEVPVRRVAVFVFDTQGRVALVEDEGRFGLPGGRPEPGEEGAWEATARREVAEEIAVTLTEPAYLGWLATTDADGRIGADVRMIARLDRVLPPGRDPSSGRDWARLLVVPHRALVVLRGRDRPPRMIVDAVDDAERRWGVRATATTPDAALAPNVDDTEPPLGPRPSLRQPGEPADGGE
jgi:ADP-ribose pyrophosphatase YjhB (NUDIX family)